MDEAFFTDVQHELTSGILPYWEKNARDPATRGFYGAISSQNKGNAKEWRGAALAGHILWAYSAAARILCHEPYLAMADYAYRYLMRNFYDYFNGGMCWSVKANGDPLLPRKQVYGNAACLYGLSEYAAATEELRRLHTPAAIIMDHALSLYSLLEQFAADGEEGGYWECLNADWTPVDAPCKTARTNLHVLASYTALYQALPAVYPEKRTERRSVGAALKALARLHLSVLTGSDYHLRPAFAPDWTPLSPCTVSYGTDLEASWLLWNAACVLRDLELKKEVKPPAVKMAQLALVEGFDGGLANTRDEEGAQDETRLWWNQAEALIGFYNAWELTGDQTMAAAAEQEWRWITEHQRDSENGEWFRSVSREGKPARREPKGGNDKTCLHAARCCLELLRRRGPA